MGLVLLVTVVIFLLDLISKELSVTTRVQLRVMFFFVFRCCCVV